MFVTIAVFYKMYLRTCVPAFAKCLSLNSVDPVRAVV